MLVTKSGKSLLRFGNSWSSYEEWYNRD